MKSKRLISFRIDDAVVDIIEKYSKMLNVSRNQMIESIMIQAVLNLELDREYKRIK